MMASAMANTLRRHLSARMTAASSATVVARPPAHVVAAPQTAPLVLMLSVSAGAGHVRAAQALCSTQAMLGVRTRHLDVMDFVPVRFRRLYTDSYISLVTRYPQLWGCLYRMMDKAEPCSRLQRMRRWLERQQARALLRQIRLLRPDAIICTHFMPAELLAYGRHGAGLPCPVWVQVTDFDLHRIWIQPGVAGYFVGSDEVAFRLRAEGVAAHTIHVTGLPIMPAFSMPPGRSDSAPGMGLDPARTTVLLMGGGFGLGDFAAIAQRLLAIDPALQLIALTGRNAALLLTLVPLVSRHAGRFFACGHIDDVERYMACADLVVTKSGGMTSAECLAMGLPMVINAPIPGQEEGNADFLVEQGIALKAVDAITVEYRVRHLLAHPDQLAAMAQRAHRLARPHAAVAAMHRVLAHLGY